MRDGVYSTLLSGAETISLVGEWQQYPCMESATTSV